MITSPPTGCRIQIEHDFIIRFRQYFIKQVPEINLRFLGRNSQSINLKNTDTIFTIQSYQCFGIFLPVDKIILHTRIKPQTNFNAQSAGIFDRIRFPIVLIVPDILKRTFSYRWVRTLAHLPSIIYLKMSDSQFCGTFQLLQAKCFIDFCVLTTVAPSVHHNHFITIPEMTTNILLVTAEHCQRLQFTLAIYPCDATICSCPCIFLNILFSNSQSCNHEFPEFCDEISTFIG